jgi:hypothetical protein
MRKFLDPGSAPLSELAKLISLDAGELGVSAEEEEEEQLSECSQPWSADSLGNWMTLQLSSHHDIDDLRAQITNPIVSHNFCICVFEGAYGESESLVPLTRPSQNRPVTANPPRIFRALRPDDNWATIPFERKNLWAKLREFIVGMDTVPATSAPANKKLAIAFWVVAVLIVVLFAWAIDCVRVRFGGS